MFFGKDRLADVEEAIAAARTPELKNRAPNDR